MMKSVLVLTLLFLSFLPVSSFAQDKPFDSTKRTVLRLKLLDRTNAILQFQVGFMRSKGVDKKIWAELGKNAATLQRHLDTAKTINSALLKTTSTLNSSLTKTLGQIILQVMQKDQATRTASSKTTARMEAIEKELIEAKRAYNKACEDSNRPDLVSNRKTPAHRPTGLGS